jgi:hypothetical protein
MKLLNRRQASEHLRGRGISRAPSTLAKLATIGGGPEFQKFGRQPVYTEEALDHWLESKLSAPKRSSSSEAR